MDIFIKRINIYINIHAFNQTIVSHSYVSFKVFTRVYTEISLNVWSWKFGLKVMEKSCKSTGHHVYEP